VSTVSTSPRARIRAAVTALCVIPGTAYLLVVSADGSATFYDVSNQSVCGRWDNLSEPSACAAFYTTIVTAKDAATASAGAAAVESPSPASPQATRSMASPGGHRASPGSPGAAGASPGATSKAPGGGDGAGGVEEKKGNGDGEEDEEGDDTPNMLVGQSFACSSSFRSLLSHCLCVCVSLLLQCVVVGDRVGRLHLLLVDGVFGTSTATGARKANQTLLEAALVEQVR